MPAAVERSTMRKVYWRLLPISILTYFLCYLDRINVGFAALTMNKDLGLDAAIYGMAAGAFFWGYFLLEVPSNLILEKVGARIWIARIMVSWGLLSGATAFCVGPWSFVTMRFLLGLAEAGLFPGMILFFTYWFPDWHRAKIISGFMVALPAAVAAGSPVSTALLGLNGLWGLAGWKWMYIAEATPTVLVGLFFYFVMTDRPADAHWLSDEERKWLISTLETERGLVESKRKVTLWQSFWDPKVLLLTLNYFGIVGASIGMLLFLPQMVKQLGLTNMQVGWVSMIPYICGAIALVTWGWFSMFLTGTAAASGIAWINAVGNLGGFFGPSIVGWAKNYTGSFAGGLYALACFSLMSAIVTALWLHIPNPAPRALVSVPAELAPSP